VVHGLFPDSFSPEIKDVRRRAERYQRTIEWVGEELSEEKPPLVAIGGPAPEYDFSYAHRFAREQYAAHAEVAARAGLSLAFEPLSSVYMNTDTFICTLHDAVSLVQDVAKPNFGLLLDVWHIWREPAVLSTIKELGHRILAVHVSDWPSSEPRNQADRVIPGAGLADLAAIVGATEAAGYRGSYCLELFSHESLEDSLSRADPAWVITESRAGLAAAFEAADAKSEIEEA
jgi:sugar phosphate isomerase/epimerase